MATLDFETLKFERTDGYLRVWLLSYFFFDIPEKEILAIAEYKIGMKYITFKDISEKKAGNKFRSLLMKYMGNLKNSLNGHDTVYIHAGSGIPLLGNIAFGIVDRGTNLIEARPITGCNLNCIFCSVDEGTSTKKVTDFVVEMEYLVEEVRKVSKLKGDDMEVHINPQGEPMLYADLIPFVKAVSQIKNVRHISMDTNGGLLTEDNVRRLTKAGMTRINVSLNSLDEKNAWKFAGTKKYDVKNLIDVMRMIPDHCELTVAPVWMHGVNDKDIEELIKFGIEISKGSRYKVRIGIQNFLEYKKGRRPIKARSFEEFYKDIDALEKKYDVQLRLTADDFGIVKAKPISCPFVKDELITVDVVCHGRYHDEMFGVAKDRAICVHGCSTTGRKKIRLTRVKDGIIEGTCLR
ncbi:molybdenum cofactor biosynthesis protein MoaA [Candidatus Woesearchaeota archaeon CG11_big_fil_rev_8_21_14_0_20_43_8]|nr:MAG: molybdenum cofactor biosynthesis protein MoaA [Candidatus Woesearchaeota archaeon CG11_big_fil_rev_8_21_14_0_20_43_8]